MRDPGLTPVSVFATSVIMTALVIAAILLFL
jgi:hypothetical protein